MRIQHRRAVEFVSAEQYHADFLADVAPGGVVRLTLGHEYSSDAVVPEFGKALTVAEYLAEAEPKLMFLVLRCDALDFRDEDGAALFPCQVEVWSWSQAASGFDSRVLQDASCTDHGRW